MGKWFACSQYNGTFRVEKVTDTRHVRLPGLSKKYAADIAVALNEYDQTGNLDYLEHALLLMYSDGIEHGQVTG